MIIKPKMLFQEAIPPAFVDAMKQVADLIAAGDDTISIESDDLLQIGDVCGGLYSAAEQRYGFCLCCRREGGEPLEDEYGTIEWCFHLGKAEIAEIAMGAMTRINMWRCSAYDCGRRWSEPDGYCTRCDFLP